MKIVKVKWIGSNFRSGWAGENEVDVLGCTVFRLASLEITKEQTDMALMVTIGRKGDSQKVEKEQEQGSSQAKGR